MTTRSLLCLLWFATAPALALASEAPNILIILVDDMGYGDPQCFNPNSKIETPNINQLAASGMRFTDAHSPGPLCHMSRYGLMTGRYPFRANVGEWRKRPLITPEQTTVPSLLRARNYSTAMVGKWHLGFKENGYENPLPGGPVDVGFDSFFGIRASTDIPPYFYIRDRRAVSPPTNRIEKNSSTGWSPIQGAFWRAGGIAPDLKLDEVLPRFTNEAIRVIEQHAPSKANEPDSPLFLYLAYPAPHTPWLPSESFRNQSPVGMYGDFVTMVDSEIGRVLASLEKTEMDKNTLVFFTSDNGPVWYPHDTKRLEHDSCGGLRGMKADAWEAGHRMPFIASWPGKIEAGTQTSQTIGFTDLLATLAAIVEYPRRPDEGPDSVDFSKVLLGTQPESDPIRTELVMRSGSGHMTVRQGVWKYINRLGSGGFSKPKRVAAKTGGPSAQLYDLSSDLAEEHNLILTRPDIAKQLQQTLERVKATNVE